MTNRQGFTVVEVLVAIMVLGVGILALVGSSMLVTRMIGEGKRSTFATQMAQRRIELVRREAMRTTPQCTAVPAATGTATSGRITERKLLPGLAPRSAAASTRLFGTRSSAACTGRIM